MFKFNPLTIKKLKRFREIRRGYYSAVLLICLTVGSLFAELLINDRAIFISYQGQWHFPTYAVVEVGSTYGLTGIDAVVPVNYRALQAFFEGTENTVIMPLIPWGPKYQ